MGVVDTFVDIQTLAMGRAHVIPIIAWVFAFPSADEIFALHKLVAIVGSFFAFIDVIANGGAVAGFEASIARAFVAAFGIYAFAIFTSRVESVVAFVPVDTVAVVVTDITVVAGKRDASGAVLVELIANMPDAIACVAAYIIGTCAGCAWVRNTFVNFITRASIGVAGVTSFAVAFEATGDVVADLVGNVAAIVGALKAFF